MRTTSMSNYSKQHFFKISHTIELYIYNVLNHANFILHLTRFIVKLLVIYIILHHGYHSIFEHLKMCYSIGKCSNVYRGTIGN